VKFDCIVGCCVPGLGIASYGQANRLAVAEDPIFQLKGCLSSRTRDIRLGVEIFGKGLNVDGEHDADRCQQAREHAKADPEHATCASQAHILHDDAVCGTEDAHPKHHECGSRGQSHAHEAGQLPEVDGPCGKSNQRHRTDNGGDERKQFGGVAEIISRVGSPPALPAAHHRGRVWEPFQGSHVGVPAPGTAASQ